MSLIEKEGFNCPYCGLELEDPEGYAFHVETHLMIQKEDEELAAETSSEKPETKPSKAESTPRKEKEELSDSEIITPIKMTVLAEEAEMKEYGYRAPKAPEQLGKEDLDIQAKSWFIRRGMVKLSRFLMGLEDWDKDNYYTPYRKEFDPSQYKVFGLNLEIHDVRTREEAEKLSEELKTLKKDFSPSDLKKALKPLNQFEGKMKEELSKDYYLKLVDKLRDRFVSAWESESRNIDHSNPSHRTQSFNNHLFMLLGKEIFHACMLTIHDYTPESIESVTSSMPKGSLIEIDRVDSPYTLSTRLPSNMPNEWDEMANICRISYAVSRKWIPQSFKEIQDLIGKDKCKAKATALKYDDIIDIIDEKDFKDVTNRIFHDAVESVARIWYRAWNIFTR